MAMQTARTAMRMTVSIFRQQRELLEFADRLFELIGGEIGEGVSNGV